MYEILVKSSQHQTIFHAQMVKANTDLRNTVIVQILQL